MCSSRGLHPAVWLGPQAPCCPWKPELRTTAPGWAQTLVASGPCALACTLLLPRAPPFQRRPVPFRAHGSFHGVVRPPRHPGCPPIPAAPTPLRLSWAPPLPSRSHSISEARLPPGGHYLNCRLRCPGWGWGSAGAGRGEACGSSFLWDPGWLCPGTAPRPRQRAHSHCVPPALQPFEGRDPSSLPCLPPPCPPRGRLCISLLWGVAALFKKCLF